MGEKAIVAQAPSAASITPSLALSPPLKSLWVAWLVIPRLLLPQTKKGLQWPFLEALMEDQRPGSSPWEPFNLCILKLRSSSGDASGLADGLRLRDQCARLCGMRWWGALCKLVTSSEAALRLFQSMNQEAQFC